ncbi:MAG: CPBP family intramembrane metalloprotease [Bacillota bacterium]|nr:CPBP family intramembrane metalloprotease [Bacillota bacterium]
MEYLKKLKKYCIIILFTLGVIVFQDYLNKNVSSLARHLYPYFSGIDPDNAFAFLFLHHFIQAVVYLLLILLAAKVFRFKIRDFGFNLKEYRKSIKYTLIFAAVWAVIQFGTGLVFVLNGQPVSWNFRTNTRNFTGYFLFEVLFSGTSEELFFRGLVITLILIMLKNSSKTRKESNIFALVSATLIFMAAHIGFTLMPFRVTYINWLQQGTAMIFGVFYGVLLLRTKSLLGPILAHNLLNGVITLSGMLLYFIF